MSPFLKSLIEVTSVPCIPLILPLLSTESRYKSSLTSAMEASLLDCLNLYWLECIVLFCWGSLNEWTRFLFIWVGLICKLFLLRLFLAWGSILKEAFVNCCWVLFPTAPAQLLFMRLIVRSRERKGLSMREEKLWLWGLKSYYEHASILRMFPLSKAWDWYIPPWD